MSNIWISKMPRRQYATSSWSSPYLLFSPSSPQLIICFPCPFGYSFTLLFQALSIAIHNAKDQEGLNINSTSEWVLGWYVSLDRGFEKISARLSLLLILLSIKEDLKEDTSYSKAGYGALWWYGVGRGRTVEFRGHLPYLSVYISHDTKYWLRYLLGTYITYTFTHV